MKQINIDTLLKYAKCVGKTRQDDVYANKIGCEVYQVTSTPYAKIDSTFNIQGDEFDEFQNRYASLKTNNKG